VCDPTEFLHDPVDESLRLLGRRWATRVFMRIVNGSESFNVLLRAEPRISPRSLSGQLSDLEKTGLIEKTKPSPGSRRVFYRVTPKGEDLRLLLREMAGFSLKWHGRGA